MADNLTLNAGSGGATLATDDIGGTHYQIVKIAYGALDTATLVSTANPVPVSDAGGNLSIDDGGNSITVDNGGTFAVQAAGAAAHDAAVSGGPVLTGAYASATAPSDVSADGDAVRLWALRNGSQVVNVAAAGALIGATSNALDVNIKSGSSAGTEYTEDAAAAANPAGGALIVVRDDARGGSLTTTDGDNVALRGTNSGEVYVKHVDAIPVTDNSGSLTVDGTVAVSSITTSIVPGTAATNLGKAEDAGHSSGDVGVMALSVRQDTAAALGGTDADYQPLITDASGRLHVNVGNTVTVGSHAVTNAGTFAVQATLAAGAAAIAKAEDVASADADVGVPAMAVRKATPANTSGTDGDYEMLQMSAGRLWVDGSGVTLTVASHAVTNAGTFAVQVDGNALTSLQLIDDTIIADDAAFTVGTTKVNMAGYTADESSTDSVDEGDAGAARMTLDRKQIVTSYAHAAAGGATPYQNLDVDESEDDIKTAAGKLFWVHAINLTAVKQYLKFYNATAANTTVGSTTPVLTFPIPTMADTNGAGFAINFGDVGVQFDTAICVAATTGFAVADTGAPATNAVILNVGYL